MKNIFVFSLSLLLIVIESATASPQMATRGTFSGGRVRPMLKGWLMPADASVPQCSTAYVPAETFDGETLCVEVHSAARLELMPFFGKRVAIGGAHVGDVWFATDITEIPTMNVQAFECQLRQPSRSTLVIDTTASDRYDNSILTAYGPDHGDRLELQLSKTGHWTRHHNIGRGTVVQLAGEDFVLQIVVGTSAGRAGYDATFQRAGGPVRELYCR
jgi:hypothetical protein